MPRSHRSALASFRCGTAPLRIETGRYEGLPVEERTCFMCPGSVESEHHVITTCPLYDDIRDDLVFNAGLLYPGFSELSADEQFKTILSNELLVTTSARACRKILDRRCIFMYR